MHNFLMIPVSVIPQWTKDNVPTYSAGMFSNDGQFMLIDDAHPETTYLRWLGPNADQLPAVLAASTSITVLEIKQMSADPQSIWFTGGDE